MKEFINNLKIVWKYGKEKKSTLILMIITNIFLIGVNIIIPVYSAKIIVELTNNNLYRVIYVSLVMFIIALIRNVFTYIVRKCSISLQRLILNNLQIDLSNNILKVNNKSLDDNGSGTFISRLTGDTNVISDSFNYIINSLSNLIKYIGYLIAILIINKIMFIFVLLYICILYLFDNYRTTVKKKNRDIVKKSNDKVYGFIGELVRGSRDIKMLNSEKDFIKELDVYIKDSNEKTYKMESNWNNTRIVAWSLIDIFELISTVLIVGMIMYNKFDIAIALVLNNYCQGAIYIAYLFDDLLDYIKNFNLSAERVLSILSDTEFKKEKFGKKHLNKLNGNFEFKNVSFGYEEKLILKDISFNVKANETVAFVGKSGAGKTTIFNLLCKMYDVNSGKITIDNVDINELDKESIRGNITIISQNPYIFNLSIRDNLRLVKSDMTDEDMIEACKLACLDDFISSLSNGYDTIIGEGGVNLSGGQKQRLAIARALVQKTGIILFDEATSALDNETQEKIQMAIENMKNKYTIMIIAHRLSTIINSDRILFLNNGVIECEGTHEELLKNFSDYRKLYESEISKK